MGRILFLTTVRQPSVIMVSPLQLLGFIFHGYLFFTAFSTVSSSPFNYSSSLDTESVLYHVQSKDGENLSCYSVVCTSPFERCNQNGTHDRCLTCKNGSFFLDAINSKDWPQSSPLCLSKVRECEHACPDLSVLVNKEECGVTQRAVCRCDLPKAFGTDPLACEEYDGRCDIQNKQLTLNGDCEDCPHGTEKLKADNSRCQPIQRTLFTEGETTHDVNFSTQAQTSTTMTSVHSMTTLPTANGTAADISQTDDISSLPAWAIAVLIVVGAVIAAVISIICIYKAIVWAWPNGCMNGVPCFMANSQAAPQNQNNGYIPNMMANGAQNGPTVNGVTHSAQNGPSPTGTGDNAQNGPSSTRTGDNAQNRLIPSGRGHSARNGHIPTRRGHSAQNGQIPNGHIPTGHSAQNGFTVNGVAHNTQNGHTPDRTAHSAQNGYMGQSDGTGQNPNRSTSSPHYQSGNVHYVPNGQNDDFSLVEVYDEPQEQDSRTGQENQQPSVVIEGEPYEEEEEERHPLLSVDGSTQEETIPMEPLSASGRREHDDFSVSMESDSL